MKRIIIFSLLLFASMVVTTTNAQSGSVNVTYNGNCDWTVSFSIMGLDPNSPVFIDASVNEIGCGDHGPGSGWTNWQYGNTDSNGNVSLAVIHGGWGSFSYTFRTTSKSVVVDFSYGNPNETNEAPPPPAQDLPPNVESQPNESNPQVQIQNQPQPNDNFFRGSMYALSGDYIQVVVSGLNIRTGPSTRNTSLGHVVNGNYYQLIEQSNGWGRISTSRGEGWVFLGSGYITIFGEITGNCSVPISAYHDSNRGGEILAIPLNPLPTDFTLYFEGRLVRNSDWGVRHDIFAGEPTSGVTYLGIGRRWIYSDPRNWNWDDDNQWFISYRCNN